jgi:hypothetical protein
MSIQAHLIQSITSIMSGIEVAGIVLGAIPIILAGRQFYAEGVRVTTRYLKYEKGVEDPISQLKTEHTIYLNSIELILDGVIKQKDLEDFLADLGGERWKDPVFATKLHKQLGSSCTSYPDAMCHLVIVVERLKYGRGWMHLERSAYSTMPSSNMHNNTYTLMQEMSAIYE